MSLNNNKINNITIIDWDDTLFPTNWVSKNNVDMNNKDQISSYSVYFLELDKTISNFLLNLSKDTKIYIITNANITWINLCLKSLPKTSQIIKENNIEIISARDRNANYNISPNEWKIYTFQDVFLDTLSNNNDELYNIMSIGDAMYEYNALLVLGNKLSSRGVNNNLKSIKLKEKPEFDLIIEQMILIDKNIDKLVKINDFIDVKTSNI